ncbi:pyridoxamine 5'-phosphate oxidase [Filimonas effusa]|uniref:Pyridoxine/pyridoxamine 5'-phosphate oxidase n=1 Tax=Filimonas effusa TaxID=2508721 RepID=A0A4Q1D1Z9_9BACT|nr:pyridoxamine 5'-phosphate oxidase [Filimonas effusa]
MQRAIADIRTDYSLKTLDESVIAPDAIDQFTTWWNEAIDSEIEEANVTTVATATKDGIPDARIILLKSYDKKGFVFFTNYNSVKAQELAENPKASMIFFWKELQRQVRVFGTVEKISAADNDEYFNSRPEGSRIGAWASPQSHVIADRTILDQKIEAVKAEFAGKPIPRPEFWGGYLIKPETVEFWQGRSSRLHDRIKYTRQNNNWKIERLAP